MSFTSTTTLPPFRGNNKKTRQGVPRDGVAPLKQIVSDLAGMGGTKVLSLELFNLEYWKNDPLAVA